MYELVDILTSERLRLVSDWREITSAELLPGRAICLTPVGADAEQQEPLGDDEPAPLNPSR